jgi:adenosylmethionine-8-amino-7-oxononanoate aminotransferase
LKFEMSTLWPFIPRRSMPEVVRAEGAYFYLRDGRQILDVAGSGGVVNIGHGRVEVVEAAARALQEVSYAVPGFMTPHRLALLKNLQENWLPDGLNCVHLASGGSEAVEAAIIVARMYQAASGRPDRWKVIGRDVSYHGGTLGSLAVGGHDKRKNGLGKMILNQPLAPSCYCLRCPFEKHYPGCNVTCALDLETLIKHEGPDSIAAFIAEPIVGPSGGALVPPDEYWRTIRDICYRYDILLIVDEVTTGFGRTGSRYAVDHWALLPDILVVGKGFSSGYAILSALFTSEPIAKRLADKRMKLVSHTYAGHPGACAATNAVLNILRGENLIQRVKRYGPKLGEKLVETLGQHPHVAEVRGKGFLWAIELVRNRDTLELFPQETGLTRSVFKKGLEMGMFFYPGGTGSARDIIVLSPPFIIGEKEIDEIATVLNCSIDRAIDDL